MKTFVARQPILDRKEQIFAYELLFRQGNQTSYTSVDGDRATEDVIANSFLSIGMDTLTGGKRGFINFTTNLLKSQIAYSLPKEHLVLEILENVEPEQDIILACKRLKEAGYLLALDDFVFAPKFWPLIDLADIIKVDFLGTDVEERRNIMRRIGSRKIKFLAEKVETRADFEQALKMGYSYFQGYHFKFEEELFERYSYKDKMAHIKEHDDFREKVINFNNNIKMGQGVVNQEILKFLIDWLVNHILILDKEYSAHLVH